MQLPARRRALQFEVSGLISRHFAARCPADKRLGDCNATRYRIGICGRNFGQKPPALRNARPRHFKSPNSSRCDDALAREANLDKYGSSNRHNAGADDA